MNWLFKQWDCCNLCTQLWHEAIDISPLLGALQFIYYSTKWCFDSSIFNMVHVLKNILRVVLTFSLSSTICGRDRIDFFRCFIFLHPLVYACYIHIRNIASSFNVQNLAFLWTLWWIINICYCNILDWQIILESEK